MVSDKNVYRLLSAIESFKGEAAGDAQAADVVKQLDAISADLKAQVGPDNGAPTPGDNADTSGAKPNFDTAAAKTKNGFPFQKKGQ